MPSISATATPTMLLDTRRELATGDAAPINFNECTQKPSKNTIYSQFADPKVTQTENLSMAFNSETPSFILVFICFLPKAFIFGVHGKEWVAPTGTWQLLVENAGIATMHAAVTRYNTVVLLDRTNIGKSQIDLPNGKCRDNSADQMLKHDCTAHSVMYDIEGNEIRPLYIFTDTWCSSGAFLPNGTLLQTGGYADGFKKIRTITPCSADGDCDWVETDTNLSDGRWYATNQLLPDGRVIIVGGLGVFTYEFVPSSGKSIELPFLQETQDNQNDNLYPYVHLMPNGNLYIFANRDSIEFNYKTNVVVRKYPTITGEPRNYPSAGSSVLLPLDGPSNFSDAEVMVCGGAHAGAYSSGIQYNASQTCGRMVITSSNPTWKMSEMPMPRNMGDMVILPSGEVLIINGAGKGSQGYGMASDAVLAPVIYKPWNRRFITLNATTIPRVYHSTANLLPDARVLVAGSNTHYSYVFTGTFPTELRIEAFSPPYLDRMWDSRRPQIVDVPAAIKYGQTFTVTFTLKFTLKDLQMNMLSAPFVTHSYAQGQRMLRLKVGTAMRVATNTYSVAVTAPDNGNLAPSAYYMIFPLIQGIPGKAAWVHIS